MSFTTECLGHGGFGIFLNYDQIKNLLTKLNVFGKGYVFKKELALNLVNRNTTLSDDTDFTLSSIPENKGFKLLQLNSHYEDEVKGLYKAMQMYSIDSHRYFAKNGGETVGFSITNTASQFDFKCMDQKYKATKTVKTYTLYFVCMDVLESMDNVKTILYNSQTISDYNTQALEMIVNPLLIQLKSLHDKGLYHRDIKPANIMYNASSKQAVFIDFGLLTDKISFGPGTNYYMSPGYAAAGEGVNFMNIVGKDGNEDITKRDMLIKLINFFRKSNMLGSTLVSYSNFFWFRSLLSFKNNLFSMISKLTGDVIKKEKVLKKFMIKHNDYYALGISIKEICGSLIPNPNTPSLPPPQLGHIIETSKRYMPHKCRTGLDSHTVKQYTNKPLLADEWIAMIELAANSTNLNGGGGRKKSGKKQLVVKKHVLGKERIVFKRQGHGNTLYIVFHKKEVPLKDAKQLEKRIEAIKRSEAKKRSKR